MPYLTQGDIEAIAQRVTTAYRKLPNLCGITKIDPERLVTDLLGLSISYHVLSRHGTILGLTAYGDIGIPIYDDPEHPEYCFIDPKTVLVDKSLLAGNANVGRYHFTLIHEACHQVFRMLFPKAYSPPVMRRQLHFCTLSPCARDAYWEEWRTNRLASAILMPADMVQMNMLTFGLGDKLKMLNSVFAPDDYQRFSDMAGYMGVSKKALSIRMKQLGLLDQDYLGAPYDLINIYPEKGAWDNDAESEYQRS